jgi:hypothetical protein
MTIIVASIAAFSHNLGGAQTKSLEKITSNIDTHCSKQPYQRIDALLQFLYKFDGNLPPINTSKIKRLDFLIDQFASLAEEVTDEQRRSAFKELWSDADYWQYKSGRSAKNLIQSLEALKKANEWEKNKELIREALTQKARPYGNIFYSMRGVLESILKSEEFFRELEESVAKLKELKQFERLEKSLPTDSYQYGFQVGILRNAPKSLMTCNFMYAEELISQEQQKRFRKSN